LNKLKKFGVEPKKSKVDNKLINLSFAVTGTISTMSRDQIADKIRQLGGKFASTVNKDTDYLIVGEAPGKSKIDKATQLNIKQIDEAGLMSIFDK
jgi:NAD-dependent DNA ligase